MEAEDVTLLNFLAQVILQAEPMKNWAIVRGSGAGR